MSATIRVGVAGWTFEPWRDNFYPAGLPHAHELEYASRKLSAIEINGTFYRTQSAATFAKWRDATPEGFMFSLKALRYTTHRRVLAEAGESVEHFVRSGIAELGAKLGPVVWQFAPNKRFDESDFEAFLRLLPANVDGVGLQHAVEVRHESFKCEAYLRLARRHRVTTVFTDSTDYPSFADLSGPFVYVRTMRTQAGLPQGCTPTVLNQYAACARTWRDGSEPIAVPRVAEPAGAGTARDVYLFFVAAAKERAPAAAMAVIERL